MEVNSDNNNPSLDITYDKNILLIGSTGAGKSSLGNFLMNPRGNLTTFYFDTNDGADACTQDIKIQTKEYQLNNVKYNINIIDTPGLNENNINNDVENIKK